MDSTTLTRDEIGTNASAELMSCNETACILNIGFNFSLAGSLEDNDENHLALENFQLLSRFWVQRILVPIIMAIGVIGNTVTIVIMTQRRMRSSTNCYLAALAILDMSYLIFSFLLSFQHYPHIHDLKYHFYWILWPYMLTLADASSNSSVWLTVTFTVERYIAVCHPMKGKIFCTESRAKKMIIIVFIACFLVTLPTAFEWKIIEVPNQVTNVTQIWADYSDLGHNRLYVSVYYWAVSVVFIMIPFILLAVFNAFLIRSVHSSKSRRKTMTRRAETGDQAKQESKITIMLIAVVILFFLCQLPTAAILLYRSFQHVEDGGREDLLLRGLGNIFNFLMAVNAAGNFVLYCLLSMKYRRTFVQIFCSCWQKNTKAPVSGNANTFYSTIGNESPNPSRKYSVRPTAPSLKPGAGGKGAAFRQPFYSPGNPKGPQQQQQDYPNSTGVYCKGQNMKQLAVDDTRYARLLRGFRCPWKRQKIVSRSNPDEQPGQLAALRSYSTTDKEKWHSRMEDNFDNTQI